PCTGSVTATVKPEAGGEGEARRPPRPGPRGWNYGDSRLGRLIVVLNVLSLLILVAGAFGVNEQRRGLLDARIAYLTAQAQLVAAILGEAEATQGDPEPALDPIRAALVLREVFIPEGQRARLFDADGELIGDSYIV